MSLPDPRRPVVGDTYTHEGGWTTEVLAVDRHNVTIRVTLNGTLAHESTVSRHYFISNRSSTWVPQERT